MQWIRNWPVLKQAVSEMTAPERGRYAMGFEQGSVRHDSSWKRMVWNYGFYRDPVVFCSKDTSKDNFWEDHSWKGFVWQKQFLKRIYFLNKNRFWKEYTIIKQTSSWKGYSVLETVPGKKTSNRSCLHKLSREKMHESTCDIKIFLFGKHVLHQVFVFPWDIHRISMDYQWIIHGLSIDYP